MNSTLISQLEKISDFKEKISFISENVKGKIVFSTSLGIEDQVIYHKIISQKVNNIEIFTLDTGRLFSETYKVWDKTLLQYGTKIKAYYPNAEILENFISENGINCFYNSVEMRKKCCNIRKVEPLKRALQGAKIWITGLRAEQSENRNNIKLVQWDEQYHLYKFNPLLNWTKNQVVDYLNTNGVPYNSLHHQGYVSIGCAPCTRQIKEGEDFRAGRWWWEDNSKKECGLHK